MAGILRPSAVMSWYAQFEKTHSTGPSHFGSNFPLDRREITIGRFIAKTRSLFLKEGLRTFLSNA